MPLTEGGRDLDNYLLPIAQRLGPRRAAAMFGRKTHGASWFAVGSVNEEVLAGSLDPRTLQFVREWASLRRDEVMANWERARRNEQMLAIEPLA